MPRESSVMRCSLSSAVVIVRYMGFLLERGEGGRTFAFGPGAESGRNDQAAYGEGEETRGCLGNC